MSRKLMLEIQGYAQVSRSLRTIERRHLDNGQLLRINTRLSGAGIPERQMARIMKRAKSRTVAIIRGSGIKSAYGKSNELMAINVPMPPPEAAWIEDADDKFNNAHTERTVYLRRELRAANLAYAFLKGISLESAEAKGYEPIPFDRIEEIAEAYSDDLAVMNNFPAWKIDAVAHGKHPVASKPSNSPNDKKRADAKRVKMLEADYGRAF